MHQAIQASGSQQANNKGIIEEHTASNGALCDGRLHYQAEPFQDLLECAACGLVLHDDGWGLEQIGWRKTAPPAKVAA